MARARAGGSWVTPWTKLDYVRAQLASIDYTLRVCLKIMDGNLLTMDELDLLEAVGNAQEILERIMQ